MSEARGWRWIDPSGVERTLSTAELRAGIASGRIPRDAQVSREGIEGWIRASDVQELFPRTLTPPPPKKTMKMEVPVPPPPPVIQEAQKAFESVPPPRPPQTTIPGAAPPPGPARVPSAQQPVPTTQPSPGGPRPPEPKPEAAPAPPPARAPKATLLGIPAPARPQQITAPSLGTAPKPVTPKPPEAAKPETPKPPEAPKRQETPKPLAVPKPPVEPEPQEMPQPVAAPIPPATLPFPGKGKTQVLSPIAPFAAISAPAPETPAGGAVTKPMPFEEPPVEEEVHIEEAPPSEPPPPPRVGPRGTALLETVKPPSVAPPPAAPVAAPPPAAPAAPIQPQPPIANAPSTLVDTIPPARVANRKMLLVFGGAVGVIALVGVVAVIAAVLRKPAPPPPDIATASAPPGSAPPATSTATGVAPPPANAAEGTAAACGLAKPGARLSARASKDIPIELAPFGGMTRVAIGFSLDGKTPLGISVDPTTMTSRRERVPRAMGKLRRVVPIPAPPTITWVVDADSKKGKLERAETVAVEPPYEIGLEGTELASLDKPTSTPRKLWPIPGGSFDAIRTVPIPGEGVLVALRAGSSILTGMVGPDRGPKGDLEKISDSGHVGTPSAGTNGVEVAVTYAWRAGASDKWGLRLSHGPKGSPLPKATDVALPPGGPGGDAFAPAIAGLADGRWVLAWTEGTSGARQVRAVTLSSTGEIAGSAFTVSPAEQNAGQATIAVSGREALAVWLTAGKAKGTFELWGASLTCP